MITPDFMLLGLTAGVSAGTAWGVGVGTIRRVSKSFDAHVESDDKVQANIASELQKYRLETTDRLARIETKLDALRTK